MSKKYLVVYLVTDPTVENIDEDFPIYCIAQTKAQCVEYIERKFRKDHNEHFTMWCDFRKFDPKKPESWNTYVEELELEDAYKILKLKYPMSMIFTLLRASFQCEPVGASFEFKLPLENIQNK